MLITETAIKRPIFSIALSLIIIIVGILSYLNLSLQQYPNAEEPILFVDTRYPEAAANIMESKVTNILEDALAGIPGLDYMSSSSTAGNSQITLYFRLGTNLPDAASDVRERIAQNIPLLPKDAKPPQVIKSSESKEDFLSLTLASPTHDDLELYDYADRNLKQHFESIPGVADVTLYGNPMTMQVRLDREKMNAYKISLPDVLTALEESSQEFPAGSIIKGKRYVNMVVDSALNTPEDMGKLIVSGTQGFLVSLKDIAEISIAPDNRDGEWFPRYNKAPAVFLGIKNRPDGNVLSISAEVLKNLEQNKNSLPKGMNIKVAYNFSVFIKSSLKAVQHSIIEATILVLIIIFFFLHSWRATIIPLVTIPISLIGSFA